MKLLVLSDSHSALSFMRRCVRKFRPDAIVHLGDYFDDGQVIAEENPRLAVYQVPGNCDRYRCSPFQEEILTCVIGGVRFYMTHGHRHQVKTTLDLLLWDARQAKAQAVLYGHTHIPHCARQSDGLWVLNPGSCGGYSANAGLIEICNGEITACTLVDEADLGGEP